MNVSPVAYLAAYTEAFISFPYPLAYIATLADEYGKDHYVPKLYNVGKKGFTCLDSEESITTKVM